ncbi:MAG: hypothetical protein ITG00_04320 [Flavobacterium sp.]|nr:hypothetical protein [Flavobacterium sp.]
MGRNKMEKEFSEKLNQREIKPSANSWDRLDAMLTVAEQKKPERRFRWMYIAASFLGFALVATIFFNREPQIEVTNKIAVEQTPAIISSDLPEKAKVIEQTAIASSEQNLKNEDNKQPVSSRRLNQNHIAQIQKEQLPVISNDAAPETINQKTDIVKADELLAVVQPTINQNQTKTVKVNAKSLLSQVDGEVELTFREKVLNKVGKNYQSVKVALANRNIEDENH